MAERTKSRKPAPEPLTLTDKPPAESIKETIDSIIIALALALVFRAFVVEAFVIPTGSMASTLLGAHRHFVCPVCHREFDVGLDAVRDPRSGESPEAKSDRDIANKNVRCLNCSFKIKDNQLKSAYNGDCGGDKILVFKFPYLYRDPNRWDVVVFYNPANPDENFIKRLIGRPGETVQILDGDIYVGTTGGSPDAMEIQRKPPEVQRTLWRGVYLNDFPPTDISGGDPWIFPHWAGGAGTGWAVTRKNAGVDVMDRLLRYQPPATAPADDALTFHEDSEKLSFLDFYGYNGLSESRSYNVVWDLRLEFVLTFRQAGGHVSLSMNHHSRDRASASDPRACVPPRFVATFHQDGNIELAEFGPKDELIRPVRTAKVDKFELGVGVPVALQNVDFQASAWVDGRQQASIDWKPDLGDLRAAEQPRSPQDMPYAGDRQNDRPTVFIRPDGRTALELRHVNLLRDVYYTTRFGDPILRGSPRSSPPDDIVQLRKSDKDPAYDEFFVMGDNSPASSDGRLWPTREGGDYWHLVQSGRLKFDEHASPLPRSGHYPPAADSDYRFGRVPRDHLIGRAFFVYWPAALPVAGGRLNAIPNVGRMRLIH